MTVEARYLKYFSAAISQQIGSGRTDTENIARELLARIEAKLRSDGFAQQIIADEMTLARAAAAEAVALAGEPRRAPAGDLETAQARDPGPAQAPSEPQTRRRFRTWHLAFVALAIAVYALPLVLFTRESREMISRLQPSANEVAIGMKIGIADFARDSVTFHLVPTAGPLLQPDGTLSHDLLVEVDPGGGLVSHTFKANTVLAPWAVKAEVDTGDILDYPFDRYELELAIDAKSEGRNLKVLTTLDHVPHGIVAVRTEQADAADDTTVTVLVRRAGTIIFLVLLSTTSLLLVSMAACAVAWKVAYRGRKIEFSMMVWTAALMFVIPTVRNALPGAAPPGALIDFLIFFWLQIVVVIAASSMVLTWFRRDTDDA